MGGDGWKIKQKIKILVVKDWEGDNHSVLESTLTD